MGLLQLIEGLCPSDEVLQVTVSRCLRARSKASNCRACADLCPAQAITFDGPEPVSVDEQRCLRCGLCVAACPTEALELPGLAPVRLLQRSEEQVKSGASRQPAGQGQACFTCALGPRRAEGGPGAVAVPCLGALSPAVLATVALHRGSVALVTGEPECGACQIRAQGWRVLQRSVEEARDTIRFFGFNAEITVIARLPEEAGAGREARPGEDGGRTTSRQEFLAGMMRGATRAGVSLLPSFLTGGEQEQEPPGQPGRRREPRLPEGRRLLLEAIRGSGGPPPTAAPVPGARVHGALPFGRVQVSSVCEPCDVCSLVCPSGALGKHLEAAAGALLHEPGRCLGCGTCVRACPRHALALGAAEDPSEVLGPPRPLARFILRACRQCGEAFWSGEEEVCGRCRAKLELMRRLSLGEATVGSGA